MENQFEQIQEKEKGIKFSPESACIIFGISKYNRVVVLKKYKNKMLTKKQWEKELKNLIPIS